MDKTAAKPSEAAIDEILEGLLRQSPRLEQYRSRLTRALCMAYEKGIAKGTPEVRQSLNLERDTLDNAFYKAHGRGTG